MNIHNFMEILKSFSVPNIVGQIVVKNVMSSHLWLITILLIFSIALNVIHAGDIFIYFSFTFIAVISFHFMRSYDHFKKKDPKYLLSETSTLKAMKIEPLGTKSDPKPLEVIEEEEAVESPIKKGVTKNKLLK